MQQKLQSLHRMVARIDPKEAQMRGPIEPKEADKEAKEPYQVEITQINPDDPKRRSATVWRGGVEGQGELEWAREEAGETGVGTGGGKEGGGKGEATEVRGGSWCSEEVGDGGRSCVEVVQEEGGLGEGEEAYEVRMEELYSSVVGGVELLQQTLRSMTEVPLAPPQPPKTP